MLCLGVDFGVFFQLRCEALAGFVDCALQVVDGEEMRADAEEQVDPDSATFGFDLGHGEPRGLGLLPELAQEVALALLVLVGDLVENGQTLTKAAFGVLTSPQGVLGPRARADVAHDRQDPGQTAGLDDGDLPRFRGELPVTDGGRFLRRERLPGFDDLAILGGIAD